MEKERKMGGMRDGGVVGALVGMTGLGVVKHILILCTGIHW